MVHHLRIKAKVLSSTTGRTERDLGRTHLTWPIEFHPRPMWGEFRTAPLCLVQAVQRATEAPFLRESIPALESNPVLHQVLTKLWYELQEAARGLGDALARDDAEGFMTKQSEVSGINTRMHAVLQEPEDLSRYLAPGSYGYSSLDKRAADTPRSDPPAENGEVTLLSSSREKDESSPSESDSGEDEERYLEADEWMESWKPD
jgi:hypothetical protein